MKDLLERPMHRRAFLKASLGAAIGGSVFPFSSTLGEPNALRSAAATKIEVLGYPLT